MPSCFCLLFSVFQLVKCIFVILISFTSYFSVTKRFIFSCTFLLLFGIASFAVSFLVAVVIMF